MKAFHSMPAHSRFTSNTDWPNNISSAVLLFVFVPLSLYTHPFNCSHAGRGQSRLLSLSTGFWQTVMWLPCALQPHFLTIPSAHIRAPYLALSTCVFAPSPHLPIKPEPDITKPSGTPWKKEGFYVLKSPQWKWIPGWLSGAPLVCQLC